MKLYVKQRRFSLNQNFDVTDGDGHSLYSVKSAKVSLRRKQTILDGQTKEELAKVKERLVSLRPTVDVLIAGEKVATITKKLTIGRDQYQIKNLNWLVQGNLFDHRYKITHKGQTLATINKKLLSLSDSFVCHIRDEEVNPVLVLAVVLAIDLVLDDEEDDD
ncbi:LURP-one-related/scramblase family protein [Hutsoniella sourekii]